MVNKAISEAKVKVVRLKDKPHIHHFRYGYISYDFALDQNEFEVRKDHLALVLLHCNMKKGKK